MMDVQDMVKVVDVQAQAFDRREQQQQPWESTSVEDIAAMSHPSYGWAPWGAGTTPSALASGSA